MRSKTACSCSSSHTSQSSKAGLPSPVLIRSPLSCATGSASFRSDPARGAAYRSPRCLVSAQRFLEQINRLIARAVDKLLHKLACLRESVRRHRLELRLELLGRAEFGEQVFPEVHRFLLQLNARLQGLLITAHGLVKDLVHGFRRCRGCLFGSFNTHVFSLILFFVFVVRAPDDSGPSACLADNSLPQLCMGEPVSA